MVNLSAQPKCVCSGLIFIALYVASFVKGSRNFMWEMEFFKMVQNPNYFQILQARVCTVGSFLDQSKA